MRNIFICLIITALAGCAQTPTAKVAKQNGFIPKSIPSQQFHLTSFQKITRPGKDVNIYIEGDGRAWIAKTIQPRDPSPRTRTVMRLASLDPSPNVVYLARPCQFAAEDLKTVCQPKFWSLARYSKTIVQAINSAVTQIKRDTKATKIHLIGYSGGGTLATLVAAMRNDIASIRTIAGNLDLRTMDAYHNTTPLSESLDPMAIATLIRHIPQIHFAGAKDDVVPPMVAQNFVRAAKLNPNRVVIVPDAGHATNWHKHWPQLLERIP